MPKESSPTPATRTEHQHLYDLAPASLRSTLTPAVDQPFRIRQVEEWLYEKGVDSFDAMTNLPKELRSGLASRFDLAPPMTVRERTAPAADGTQKFLFTLFRDGGLIEAVHMPAGDRTTLCLSSQAGCAVGCTFCVTGFFGPGRNLTPSEILGQIETIRREKSIPNERLNIVFMGMGEPLLNFENVMTSMDILAHRVSPRRVTLSTSGITPAIERLAKIEARPNLAVSINAPDRKRREEIMPITKKYPLDELMRMLRQYPVERGRDITMEYVLLAGYNDSPTDARDVAKLLRGIRCKVNVIPFNPDPNLPDWMKRPTEEAIDDFVDALVDNGARVTVRRSKGRDISAACGQLRGKTEPRRRPAARR